MKLGFRLEIEILSKTLFENNIFCNQLLSKVLTVFFQSFMNNPG